MHGALFRDPMRGVLSTFGLAAAVFVSGAASAAPRPLPLREALRAGAASGPGVAVASAPARMLPEARSAARAPLVTTPSLTAAVGPRFGSATTVDVQVGIYVPIALRDVSGARGAVVGASERLVAVDVARARNDGAFRAGVAWANAVEGKELVAVRADSLSRADAIVLLAERRARAGVALPSEIVLARGERAASAAQLLDAEGRLVEAVVELRVAIGASVDADVEAGGDLGTDALPAHANARRWARSGGPEIDLATAREAAARAEVTLVHRTAGPSLSVGGMFAREGDGSSIVLGQLAIPLPFVDPAAFERTRGQAVADAAIAATYRARAEHAAATSLALHEMDHAREVRAVLEREALPALREAERLAVVQVSVGASDVSLALVARQRRLAAEETLTHARADVVRADLRFAHVTGHLVGESP